MIEAEKIKAENAKKQQEKALAYKRLFATSDGKIVKKDLEDYCGFYRPSICEQSPNAEQTAFNEGKRIVYLRIEGFIRKEEENA